MAGADGWRQVAPAVVVGGWWLEGGGRRMVVQGAGGLVWWRIATEPNRNSAILAIHTQLNTAYVSVSTEPPDYNHGYRRKPETLNPEAPV